MLNINLRAKLMIPILLMTLLAIAGVVYISILHYKTFQYKAEKDVAHYKEDIHELVRDVQREVDHLVELLSSKRYFLDNVATQNMDKLLDELTPFHNCSLSDFIAVYDTEGRVIARGDSPEHFGRSDSLYPYVLRTKENNTGIPFVVLNDNKLLLLKLKSLDAGYGPIGVIAAGTYLDEEMVNKFSESRNFQLAFQYEDTVVVASPNFKMPATPDKKQFQVDFTTEFGQNSYFSAMLWKDTSKAVLKFWNTLFLVIITMVLASCAVIFFSRRIVINTVNALKKARLSVERELAERQQTQNALRHLNDELESLVQKRTQNLEDEIEVRKQTEKELSKKHYFLQKAQEIGKIGTWELDLIKNELLWTDENYKIFGVPLGTELTYEIFLDCVHPDDRNYVDAEWKASFIGKSYDIEHRLLVDGKVKWVREKAVLEFDEHDVCVRGIGFTQDITEHKLDREEIKEKEAYMRSIFRAAPTGIGVVRDRVIQQVNNRFCEMLGYSSDELVGKDAKDFYPSEEEFDWVGREKYSQIQKMGTGTVETRLQREDGIIINVLLSSTPIHHDDLSVGVTFTALDITKIKQTERSLKESEEKYRSMMEAMNDPVTICSSDYKIEYMNPAMIKRTGRDATGESCFSALHDLDKKCPWCLSNNKQNNEHVTIEIVSPKDNRSYLASHSPICREDGSISKLAIFRDITQLKQMETQLQQAQKMESIGSLAGGIAHDFNNILFPIIGISELMMEDLPCGSLEREHAHEIYKAGLRAKDLVSQILAFSRKSEQILMPVRVQNVLKEVLKLCRSTIPSNIELESNIQQDCGSVMGNATQLHQIGMNLITNSYHAVQNKNGKIVVTLQEISLENVDKNPMKYALFTVSDDGTGMTEDIKNKIFEPYFTTKEQGRGTGLGLAVVYGIVKEYGGEIEVESTVGSGTTFKIYLPIIVEHKKDNTAEIRTKPKTGDEHILLVDDEDTVANLEQQMLERLGYTVTVRGSSIEAFETFKEKPDTFDMVVSDMAMPNMTGDQLVRKIREIRPDIPIIICTGFSEQINKEKADKMGVNGFLMKPIMKPEMAHMVRNVLDEQKNTNVVR